MKELIGGGRPGARGHRPPSFASALLIVMVAASAITTAHASAPPKLAGVNTFTGSQPAKIVLTLPTGASYVGLCLSSPNASIAGGGRFPALVVMRDVPARDAEPLLIARYPAEAGGYVHSSSCSDQPFALPAGQYLVYLLPDGAPVSITLRLGGLTGTAAFVPAIPVAHALRFPGPAIPNPTRAFYSSGAIGSLRSKGMLFHTVWTSATATALTEAGSCTNIASKSPYPSALRYTPVTCMLGGGGLYGINDFPLSAPAHHSFMQWAAPPEVYGVGGYVMGAGLYRNTGMLSLWLSYD